jgi:NADPH:quinone reductase-like Zn-dependent oxidoreductase
MVIIGLMGGSRCEIDLGMLLGKRLKIIGSVLRSRLLAEKIELTREFIEHVMPLFELGRLQPVTDRAFGLAHAAEAHEFMERNENLGKIILLPGPCS